MKFIAIDLELDQPSNAIIQLGAVAFDTDAKRGVGGAFNVYVDPGTPVNWGHTLNIGITLEELLPNNFRPAWESANIPTKEAMEKFWKWVKSTGSGKKFIQWGRGDHRILLEHSQGCGYPSHTKAFDLKMAYQFLWQPAARLEKQSQLTSACVQLGVRPPVPAHCAYEDALATGKLALHMFRQVQGVNSLLQGLGYE